MEVEGFEGQQDFELAASKPLNSSRAMMNRRFQASQDKNIFVQQRQPLVGGPYGKIKQSTPQNVVSPVSRSINMHLTPVGGQIQPLPNQPNSHRSLRPKTGENGVFMGKSKIGQ